MMSQEHVRALREEMAVSQGWLNLANAAAFLWDVVMTDQPLSEAGTEELLRMVRESMAAVRISGTRATQ